MTATDWIERTERVRAATHLMMIGDGRLLADAAVHAVADDEFRSLVQAWVISPAPRLTRLGWRVMLWLQRRSLRAARWPADLVLDELSWRATEARLERESGAPVRCDACGAPVNARCRGERSACPFAGMS
jgi:hypothetical protein